MDRAVAFSSILLGFEQLASERRQTKIGDPKNKTASPAWRSLSSGIHGQFMIVICRVPPSFEGTVNFSTLRWHAFVDDAGGAAASG